MENCSRCEQLPEKVPDEGTLYISGDLEHTRTKLLKLFEQANMKCSIENQILLVSYTGERLKSVLNDLLDQLSQTERDDTRVVPVPEDREPEPGELISANTLNDLIGRIRGRWLIDMIREDRMYNVFQPIVRAKQPDQIYGYECLLRGNDRQNNTIKPGRIFQAAEHADLVFQLDRRARILAVQNAQSSRILPDGKIFINFLPTSIYDPQYCLNTTMDAIDETNADPEQFVFEIVESEQVDDREKLIDIITFYREKGFKVALDDFGAGYSSLEMLSDIKPDILKLDMGLVQKVPRNVMNTELCDKILTIASNHDITTLAEGIETEEQYRWFQDKELHLTQGFLFAKPATPPPERIQFSPNTSS